MSKNISTNIGRKFLEILDKSFPPSNPLSKLFNRNSVKVSYSCMPNIGQIISKHNKSVTNSEDGNQSNTSNCNCQDRTKCPVGGNCQTKGVVYQATVKQNVSGQEDYYVGLADTTFKLRFNSHTNSFRHLKNRHETTLSDHIWKLKLNNVDFQLNWRIISKARSYSPTNKICNLCNRETYFIIYKSHMATLNKRNELMSQCRHRAKFKLTNQD